MTSMDLKGRMVLVFVTEFHDYSETSLAGRMVGFVSYCVAEFLAIRLLYVGIAADSRETSVKNGRQFRSYVNVGYLLAITWAIFVTVVL